MERAGCLGIEHDFVGNFHVGKEIGGKQCLFVRAGEEDDVYAQIDVPVAPLYFIIRGKGHFHIVFKQTVIPAVRSFYFRRQGVVEIVDMSGGTQTLPVGEGDIQVKLCIKGAFSSTFRYRSDTIFIGEVPEAQIQRIACRGILL
ncbi:hypothetical protein Barb4_02519 [Bacteroidales bacterium Barb4]|nr:hypothetical protein Barb4_02519 [Bacteroidales bacterium Barb4]